MSDPTKDAPHDPTPETASRWRKLARLFGRAHAHDDNPVYAIHINAIDGVRCMLPGEARRIADGQYEITTCADFDAEDTGMLLEYLPGDVVQVECDNTTALISAPQTQERAYWQFLFDVAATGAPSSRVTGSPFFETVVCRIRREIEQGTRWHYPAVKEWIGRNTQP